MVPRNRMASRSVRQLPQKCWRCGRTMVAMRRMRTGRGPRLAYELKDYGGQISTKRTAQQTETARFWLMGGPVAYHPLIRQLVIAKQMNVIDSARFTAL